MKSKLTILLIFLVSLGLNAANCVDGRNNIINVTEDCILNKIDAVGPTNWYQGMYPTDTYMHVPRFPYFEITPVLEDETGVEIIKKEPMADSLEFYYPRIRFDVLFDNETMPFYSGVNSSIEYRMSNLIELRDFTEGKERSMDIIVYSRNVAYIRTKTAPGLEVKAEFIKPEAQLEYETNAVFCRNEGGMHFLIKNELESGEIIWTLLFNVKSWKEKDNALALMKDGTHSFETLLNDIKKTQPISTFLTGSESALERNLTAAMVNRVLRNQRMGGQIDSPSAIEFYGPEWDTADKIWIWFQPATIHNLWINPDFISNTLHNIFKNQREDGFVPQMTAKDFISESTQNPNLSALVTDYFRYTRDTMFLKTIYPKIAKWYSWWMENQTPDGNGIFVIGREDMFLMEAIYEYGRDNHPESHGIMPLMDVEGVDGRPNRLYLPDILACQARMAEDLAFMADVLSDEKSKKYYMGEYRRVRKWINENMWDNDSEWYYPVIRKTGEKVMKKSCTAFWLMWAGIPDNRQTKMLVKALFDPEQFFTQMPVPQIALNDPSFNPECKHWGDGNVWPIDVFHTFSGLLRYGRWKEAYCLARQYNNAVFKAIEESYQPNEYYNYKGEPEGCPIMGVAGNLPLTFKRYMIDYDSDVYKTIWKNFAPDRIN